MKLLLPALLMVIASGHVGKAGAQSYFFRHYQVENGLSNNTVYSSIQDNKGFLWFGTKDGLNRFDGYHFKLFNINDEHRVPAPDFISCVVQDNQHNLWVGSQKGVYIFDQQREKLLPFIDSLTEINSMQFDKEGQLWFIARFTLCRYNFEKKSLRIFPTAEYFEATSISLSEDGIIWVSTLNGYLNKYNKSAQNFQPVNLFSHSPPASSNWIQKMYPAGKDSLFVGTSNQGLKLLNTKTLDYQDLLTFNADKTTIYVRDIKKYSPQEFWIATESGIFIYNSSSRQFTNLKKKLSDPYSLSDNAVYTLCVDKEGGIWAGTFFGGVNYYSKQYAVFDKYFPDDTKNTISGSAVREICEDDRGNLWIGTEDAGLNELNPKTGAIRQFKPAGEKGSIAYYNIHGLFADGNDLWIGTFEHGLDILDTRTGKVRMHFIAGPGKKDLKSNFVVCLLHTSTGEIYAGTSNSLFKYDPVANGFDNAADIPANIFISCLFEDYNKTVWIGTHDRGLYYYNPVTGDKGHFVSNVLNKNSLSTNSVNAICEDSQNNLWLSTEGGGLCKLSPDRKQFSAVTTRNGLPSNFIFKVLEDDKKNLWVSSSRGLVNYNPSNGSITVYTKDNGLLNDQFNYNSGFKDAKGKMYFGSVRGLISFRPEELSKTAILPPVFVTGFQVQNKELDINKDSSYLRQSILFTNEITLPYDRSSFSIDFAALSYIAPEMTAYRFIMQGLDAEWTIIKPNRKIYFTNLSPGKYTFKLKAGINGHWSPEEKKISIRILPPLWATWWAYLLYALVILAICYYLLRVYHIIIEDRKEKEIYEAKIDFFTNVAHEIRTPLTLIKGPVENLLERVDEIPEIKEDVLTMERNTNRLIALITQILDFRQTETKGFSIDFVKVNITELLKEAYLSFAALAKKKQLNYTIDIPPGDLFAFADEEALRKILSNLFNNAVKYAQKVVTIRMLPFNSTDTGFTIEVENDGPMIPVEMREKIFEPFYRLKSAFKQQGTGLGLALAKSLTELHTGKLYLKNSPEGLNVFVLYLPVKPEVNKKEKANKSTKTA